MDTCSHINPWSWRCLAIPHFLIHESSQNPWIMFNTSKIPDPQIHRIHALQQWKWLMVVDGAMKLVVTTGLAGDHGITSDYIHFHVWWFQSILHKTSEFGSSQIGNPQDSSRNPFIIESYLLSCGKIQRFCLLTTICIGYQLLPVLNVYISIFLLAICAFVGNITI